MQTRLYLGLYPSRPFRPTDLISNELDLDGLHPEREQRNEHAVVLREGLTISRVIGTCQFDLSIRIGTLRGSAHRDEIQRREGVRSGLYVIF